MSGAKDDCESHPDITVNYILTVIVNYDNLIRSIDYKAQFQLNTCVSLKSTKK